MSKRFNTTGLTGYSGLALAVIATAVTDARDGVPDAREFLCSEWAGELVDLASDSFGLPYNADDLRALADTMPIVQW